MNIIQYTTEEIVISESVRVVSDSWQQRLSLKECVMRKFGKFEQLERRELLAGCALPWLDVDYDGFVAPRDALMVINDLNSVRGAHPFDPFESSGMWLDANFDQWVSPIDALLVINDLNAKGSRPFVLECPPPSLFVTEGHDVTPLYALGGTFVPVLDLNFHAEGGDVEVGQIAVSFRGADVRSVDYIAFYANGSQTPFATANIATAGNMDVPANHTTMVSLPEGFVVQEGEDVRVQARALIRSDIVGGVSGELLSARLVVDGFAPVVAWEVGGERLVRNDGDGVAQGEVLVGVSTPQPDKNIVGGVATVAMSMIQGITNANPDADGSSVPTGVSTFVQFEFTAAPNVNAHNGLNKAVVDSFVIVVTAENVTVDASAFTVYNKTDPTMKVSAVAESLTGTPLTGAVTGDFRVRVTGLAASDVDTVLGSGESMILALEGGILNARVNPARPSVLQGHLDLTDAYFTWLDQDNGGSTRQRGVGRGFVSSTRYSS